MSNSYTIRLYPHLLTSEDDMTLYTTEGNYAGKSFPYTMLHDLNYSDRFVLEPKLELSESKAGSFTFTVTEENRLYTKLRRGFSWEVMVFRGEEFIFAGYPVDRQTDLYGFTKFTCEGVLGFLNLVLLPGFNYSDTTVGTLFQTVIELYNAEIVASSVEYPNDYTSAAAKQRHREFSIGSCHGFSAGTFNRYTSKSLSAMEILQTRLVDYFHGLLSVAPILSPDAEDMLYSISYLPYDKEDVSEQAIEVGVNVQELEYVRNTEEFYTALVPVNSSGDVLVTSENSAQSGGGTDEDGNPVAYRRANSVIFRNLSLVKTYGLRAGLKTYSDDEYTVDSAQLIGTMLNDAAALTGPTADITVKALDTTLIDGGSPLHVGQYVQFKHEKESQTGTFRVKSLTLQLDDPTQNQIELSGSAASINERWW